MGEPEFPNSSYFQLLQDLGTTNSSFALSVPVAKHSLPIAAQPLYQQRDLSVAEATLNLSFQ
jgi:hypothetical protein